MSLITPGTPRSSCTSGVAFSCVRLNIIAIAVSALNGETPGQRFIKNDAEREQIRPRIDLFALRLLRRHIFRRAHQRAGLRHALRFERPRDAEIHDVDAAIFIGHHVLRFQIAMNDTRRVRRIQRRRNLQNDRNRFVYRQLPFFVNQPAKVSPFDELHRDELDSLRLAEIENANDVAMRHFARKDQLLLKPPQNFRMAG